jgi:hypothetical protein
MKIVFLYGRPAVGKLTVGRELTKLTSYPLFHHHFIVDAVLAVHPFGSAGFIAMREALWRAAFAEIVKADNLDGLIFTFNPEQTVPQAFIDDLFALFEAAGHETRVFELTCDKPEIERRLRTPGRSANQKLTDVDTYRQVRGDGFFETPRITHNRIVIDTGDQEPAAAAQAIFNQLN